MGWVEQHHRRQAAIAKVVFGEEKLCQTCFGTGYNFPVRLGPEYPRLVCPFCLDKDYSPPMLGQYRRGL